MKKWIKAMYTAFSIAVVTLMSLVWYFDGQLPDQFYVLKSGSLTLRQYQLLSVEQPESSPIPASAALSPDKMTAAEEVEVRLFGVIPVKTAMVHAVNERYVIPCGTPFGLKLLTEGVVIVGLNPVETRLGTVYPAVTGDLQKGDIILSVNGKPVSSNKELAEQINQSNGKTVKLTIQRNGQTLEKTIQPALSNNEQRYQCGIWVRDSSAGIGTLTFYDPNTGGFGGLGHAVCDTDTGKPMPLGSGDIVAAVISGVRKGSAGAPGELQGSFLTPYAIGSLEQNSETGVYGVLKRSPTAGEPIPVALKQEIQTGPATIYTTVTGTEPKAYRIEIERISLQEDAATKNMVVRVTDPDLLELTGGIVQGMSGSPIIQNGKLIGAVTHVFVNDPTRGYAILAENMLATLDILSK